MENNTALQKKYIAFSILLIILIAMAFMLVFKTNQKYHHVNNSNYDMPQKIILEVGDEYTLKKEESIAIKFYSNNEKIATVSHEGIIKAVGVGETIIGVKIENNDKQCEVIVKDKSNLSNVKEIKEIEIIPNQVKLKINDEQKLKVNINPIDASNQDVIWSSSDDKVVSVKDGLLKALNTGTAIIKVKTNNGKMAICNVVVEQNVNPVVAVDSILLNHTNISITVGDTYSLKSTIKPDNATDKSITWTSSDTSIALVNNGVVNALKEGIVTITAIASNGQKAICKVEIIAKEVLATRITLNYDSISIAKNDKIKLVAEVEPNNVSDKKIIWTSSDTSIAIVDNEGNVTPKALGTVNIVAKTSNNISAVTKITVKNTTYNKKAIFFGDSITYGIYGGDKGYSFANYIGENYDLKETVNAGKSGWFISNAFNKKWIVDNVKQYADITYDYVIMHGGTNDISKSVTLGTYSLDDFSGNYDTSTFIGGLEYYIYTVKKQWPNAKLGYIINYETPLSNSRRKELSPQYYSQMKEVLKKWNIGYLDLFFGSTPQGQKYSDLLQVNTTKYLPDHLHLSNEGYELISPYIYDWMNGL